MKFSSYSQSLNQRTFYNSVIVPRFLSRLCTWKQLEKPSNFKFLSYLRWRYKIYFYCWKIWRLKYFTILHEDFFCLLISFLWYFHRNEYFIAQNNSWYAAIDNKSNNSICVFWNFRKKSEIDFSFFSWTRGKRVDELCWFSWSFDEKRNTKRSSMHVEARNKFVHIVQATIGSSIGKKSIQFVF